MPTFTPFRFVEGSSEPLVRRAVVSESGWTGPSAQSQARWTIGKRRLGVNVWLAADGTVGEGARPPVGAKMFLGGHVNEVTEHDAAFLTRAGWGHCIEGAICNGWD